jgi:hypothetical protein
VSIRTHTCVIIACDGCGLDWWETTGEMFVVHYDTVAEALKDITDNSSWSVTDDHHWCPDCAAKQHCDRNGHLMGSWYPCWCQAGTDVDAPHCTHMWRQCTHCGGAFEKVTITETGVTA